MPERHHGSSEQRYLYNGMEQDLELSGNGNSYTTEFRQYDPRLMRWKSLDPLMAKYPNMSPYVAFNNNPVFFVDPLGLEGDKPGGGRTKYESGTTRGGTFCSTCNDEKNKLNKLRAQIDINQAKVQELNNLLGSAGEQVAKLQNYTQQLQEQHKDIHSTQQRLEEETKKLAAMIEDYSADQDRLESYEKALFGVEEVLDHFDRYKDEDNYISYSQFLQQNLLALKEPVASGAAQSADWFWQFLIAPWRSGGAVVGSEVAGATVINKTTSTTVFRAVSEAELDDILINGIRANPSGMGYQTGKLFATTLDDAIQFGKNNFMYDGLPNTIIQVDVPQSVMINTFKFTADGMQVISIDAGNLINLGVKPLNFSKIR